MGESSTQRHRSSRGTGIPSARQGLEPSERGSRGSGFGASEPLHINLGIDSADIRIHRFPYLSASGAFGQHQRALDRMGFAEGRVLSSAPSNQAGQSTFVTQFRMERELKTVVTVWNAEDGVQQVFLTHRLGPN